MPVNGSAEEPNRALVDLCASPPTLGQIGWPVSATAAGDSSRKPHAALELETSDLDQQPNCPTEPIPA